MAVAVGAAAAVPAPSCRTLFRMAEEDLLAEKVGRACLPPPGKSKGLLLADAGEERPGVAGGGVGVEDPPSGIGVVRAELLSEEDVEVECCCASS